MAVRHLLADCPDSYENQTKQKSQECEAEMLDNEEEEQVFFTGDFKSGKRKMVT